MDLEAKFRNLPESWVILCIVDSRKYNDFVNTLLATTASGQNFSAIYINVNRPYATMQAVMERLGVDSKRIFFIDCVSKNLGEKAERSDNCVFVQSPSDLTGISIATDQAADILKSYGVAGDKYLFLDTLSTLLIHNPEEAVAKFAHFITGRTRLLGLKGVIVSLENETDEKLVSQMSQFCDEVIRVY